MYYGPSVLTPWHELRFCKQIYKNRIDAALGLFAPSVQSTLRARSDWIIEHGGARSELIFERLELCSGRSERSELIIECSLCNARGDIHIPPT